MTWLRPRVKDTVDALARERRVPVHALDGQQLKRVPRGFDPDHPAADYLRHKRFLAGCKRPPSFATGARFYPSLVRLFKDLAPLIHFLNEPLAGKRFSLS